jgi:hypothetical protein
MPDSLFSARDVVLADGRMGVYLHDGGGTYGIVLFDRADGGADGLGVPWTSIESTGFWRCQCPRDWKIATAPYLHCDRCGASRV